MKKLVFTFFAFFTLALLPFATTQSSFAAVDASNAICEGLGAVGEGCGDGDETGEDVSTTIETVIDILSIVGAVIAVIMLIVGGIRYVTSSGDSSSTASARNTVIYALVGLIIIAMAQILVQFVVSRIDNGPAPTPPPSIDVDIPCEPPTCVPV